MMSDRPVGERGDGSRLNGMVFLSLLLHLVILSLLFFSPSFPSPKLTFGPVYTVSLVSMSGAVQEQKSPSAVAKELIGTNRSETILKKRPATDTLVPIRSLETRKKQDPNLEKAMEEIRKRAAATDAGKRPQAGVVPEKIAAPSSPPGDTEAVDAQMRAYYAMIWSRIKGRWVLAQGITPGEVLEAVIDVTILRSGAVTEVNFEKRSGNPYFDDSAMKAIRKASPFPPLPARIGESSIEVGIRFHSLELKR